MIRETRTMDALDVAHEVSDAVNMLRMGSHIEAMVHLERLRDKLIGEAQRKRTKGASDGHAQTD